MAASVDPRVAEKLERVLEKFNAVRVEDIQEQYVYYPNVMSAKLGAGSYGEAFRMKRVGAASNVPAVVVKSIPKARISRTMLQVQHLAAELAVTGMIRHPNINRCEALLHSPTTVYIVLELCEGTKPSPLERVLLLLAKNIPSRIPEAESIVAAWGVEAAATLGADPQPQDLDAFYDGKITSFMTRELGVKRELPIAHDLFNCIVYNKKLPERKAKVIMRQILLGLEHLHANNIVHRDMKTENTVIGETRHVTVLRDDDGKVTGVRVEERIDVRLIDFGLVKYMNMSSFPTTPSPSTFGGNPDDAFNSANGDDVFGQAANPADAFGSGGAAAGAAAGAGGGHVVVTPCGTEVYCALEVIQGILSSGLGRTKWQSTRSELPKLDVYGAGTVLFCMCNGRPPFRVNNTYRAVNREEKVRQIQQLIAAGPIFSSTCPPAAVEYTKLLMCNDVARRPTASQALRNEYLRGVTSSYVYDISLSGEVTEVDVVASAPAAPVAPVAASASDAAPATPLAAETVAVDEEGADDDIALNDDIMAAMRGKEDGGDTADKKAADTLQQTE